MQGKGDAGAEHTSTQWRWRWRRIACRCGGDVRRRGGGPGWRRRRVADGRHVVARDRARTHEESDSIRSAHAPAPILAFPATPARAVVKVEVARVVRTPPLGRRRRRRRRVAHRRRSNGGGGRGGRGCAFSAGGIRGGGDGSGANGGRRRAAEGGDVGARLGATNHKHGNPVRAAYAPAPSRTGIPCPTCAIVEVEVARVVGAPGGGCRRGHEERREREARGLGARGRARGRARARSPWCRPPHASDSWRSALVPCSGQLTKLASSGAGRAVITDNS